jgi:predicted HAD superfamily hydrolase/LmbE family N-acetylglucosaminyl deacetylase
MRHVELGVPVNVVVVSDGAYNVRDENRSDYVLRRRDESVAAARVMGYGTPIFWDYRDREIGYGEKLIRQVLDAIANVGADIVYAPSVFEMHPDHRALGMAAVEAVRRYGRGIRLALYEVGMPLRPNLLLDISNLAERKMAAMACFVSQNAKQRYDLDISALNRYRSYTLPANVTAAEAYILVAAEDLANDPLKLYQSEHDRQSKLGLVLDSRDMPLVSVIIRSMDRPTLSEALDSVALQTYPNIEVVIVDAKGEGHRGMGEWCGRFPLRMLGAGRRLKRSPAANFGLDAARGTYFIFLDDDDLFDPDHIAVLVEAIKDSRNCLAAYAGVRVENEAGATIAVYNQTFVAARLMSGNFLPIHAVLFKRDLVAQGCRFDENLDSYEDWDFWLQVARQTDFAHAAKVTAVYRAQLGESGMSLALAHQLQLQRQARLTVWSKWWPEWTVDDFDHIVADFRQQLVLLQGQLGDAAHNENELRRLLAEKENLQAERDRQIATLNQAVMERDEQIVQLRSAVESFLNSRSWKLTAPLRYLGRKMAYARKIIGLRRVVFDSALRYARRESVYKFFKHSFDILRYEGLNGIKLRLEAFNANHALIATGIEAKPIARIERHDFQPLSTIDITKYEYFFFDVFDTAIIRLFQRPIDLFEYVSFKTKISDFHVRRVQQEAEARERCMERKDISISEIYKNLADAAIDEEIAAELKFCIANPEVYSFYSKLLAADKKIYFVSDMYLDRSTISKILEKNGFSTYEDIYVSSEDDFVKGDGSRFVWIKKTIPESVGNAIHIGDNIVADFMQPRAHGFDALHFMESDAYYRHDSFLYSRIDFLNSKRSVGLSFMVSIFRYWKLGFHGQSPDYWRQFGFLYGGALVSAFCGFIHEQVSKISCNKVYFLARDGDIMSQVYRLLYDDVEAVYLMASRRCMSFPSIKSLTHADDADALRQFTVPIGVDGVKDVMERFCYADLHDLEDDLAKIAQDSQKLTDRDILDCILRNKKSIMEKVVKERGVLFDYLSKMNFFDNDDIVIADVGWNGSIQNYLVKLLDIWGYKKKRLHGIYLGVNDCAVHKQNMAGFLFEGDQSQFVDYFNLIELITSSPQDGIIRIDYTENGFAPVTATICEHEKRRQLAAAEIQKGILDFARIVKKRDIGSLDFIRADDFKILFRSLRDHASEEDVLQLGSLRHAAALGNNYGQHVLTKGAIKN